MKDIIFDLGGVLIDWNPRYLYKKIFASAEEMECFLTSVCSPVWNAKQDAGRPFAEGIAQAKAQYPKYAPQIDAYFLRWEEMLGGPIKGTVQLLRELKYKNYRIFALSNWSAETFPIAQKKFDFLGLFDGIVLSGEEKMNKPEPEIYQLLLDKYHLIPEECVFTDDREDNAAAAADFGIHSIVFKNREQVLREMEALGACM